VLRIVFSALLLLVRWQEVCLACKKEVPCHFPYHTLMHLIFWESGTNLCVADETAATVKRLWRSDRRWYSQLESCRWLHIIASCLSIVKRVITLMAVEQKTVILKGLVVVYCLLVSFLCNQIFVRRLITLTTAFSGHWQFYKVNSSRCWHKVFVWLTISNWDCHSFLLAYKRYLIF